MTLISYTYNPVNGDPEDISQIMANFASVAAVVNGALDNTNIAAAAGIALSKLGQGGATTGQAVVWNGTAWAPGTPGASGSGLLVTNDNMPASDVSISGSAINEGSATTIVTTTSKTYDGTAILGQFFAARVAMNGAGDITFVVLRDSTVLGQAKMGGSDFQGNIAFNMFWRDTPSAAAHTYTVKAFCATGVGGTVGSSAGGSGVMLRGFCRISYDK